MLVLVALYAAAVSIPCWDVAMTEALLRTDQACMQARSAGRLNAGVSP